MDEERTTTTLKNIEINIFNYEQIKLDDKRIKIIFDIKVKEDALRLVPDAVETKILPFLNKYIDYLKIVNGSQIIVDVNAYEQEVLKMKFKKLQDDINNIYLSLITFMENNIYDIHDYYMHYTQFCIDEHIEINYERINLINNLLRKWLKLKKKIDKLMNKFFNVVKDLNTSSNLTKDYINKMITFVNNTTRALKMKMLFLKLEFYDEDVYD